MAEAFQFELVSPERLLLSEQIIEVVVPGTEGYMTVMAHHAPLMATVKPGVVAVKTPDGKLDSYVVFGGFVDITPDGCTLLAEIGSTRRRYKGRRVAEPHKGRPGRLRRRDYPRRSGQGRRPSRPIEDARGSHQGCLIGPNRSMINQAGFGPFFITAVPPVITGERPRRRIEVRLTILYKAGEALDMV